jgi:hypothetical protein
VRCCEAGHRGFQDKRSPWASSEMQDKLRVWRSAMSPRNASTSHGRPRISTKLPCVIVSSMDPFTIFLGPYP